MKIGAVVGDQFAMALPSGRENIAFTEKAIARAQTLAPTDPFAHALTEYLTRQNRLMIDESRELFWVKPPTGQPQVATFCPMFEPIVAGEQR